MVIEQAIRWGMSPFAVAQATSVVQGKLMFEGKLVNAALNSSGILASRLTYDFQGEGSDRSVIVRGVLRGESEIRDIKVALKDAKTSNQMWTKQPDQQLVYFATRAWARRHAPEVMLGVYAPEEFDAPQARDTFTGTTIDATPEPAPEPPPQQPRKMTTKEWLDTVEAQLVVAADYADVEQVLNRHDVVKARAMLTNGALERLNSILNAAVERFADSEAEPSQEQSQEQGEVVSDDGGVPF